MFIPDIMPRKIFISLSLFLISALISSSAEGYHWPLEAPRALTSTFAEHRSGHLHAGIDLKTWGQEGCQVYAVGDGYAWRVKTSPWGYGKVLYIRLHDGKTAVYAHLADFAPPIKRLVEEEQRRLGRYSVDLYLQPHQVPVREGQLVSFSGRTGCAHPHLHFELRDSENCPLNPLQYGFSVPDQRSPHLTSLSIVPLDWCSAVEAQRSRILYPLRWNASASRYQLSSIPHTEGRVGLAVAGYDFADGAQNRLNVYALSLSLDGQEIFSATFDRFPFSASGRVALETDFDLYRKGRGIYHNLYVARGNDLPFYQPDGFGCGIIDADDLVPGYHQIRIRAQDFWGNYSEAELTLLVDERPKLEDLQVFWDSLGVHILARAEDPDGPIQRVIMEVSPDLGRRWQPLEVVPEAGGEHLYRGFWPRYDGTILLIRAWAEDLFGIRSDVRIGSAGSLVEMGEGPRFQWHLEFFHDCVELSVASDVLLAREPKVVFHQTGGEPRDVAVYYQEPHHYRGLIPLIPGLDGLAVVSITGRDLAGRLGAAGFSFPVYTITPESGGRVEDPDQRAAAFFEKGAVYEAFISHVQEVEASSPPGLPMRSPAFLLYPDDCVFQEPASISLTLAEEFEDNERIGVYTLNRKGNWSFVGRLSKESERTIEARVRDFSTFALLEDQISPLIWRVRPQDGTWTRQRYPVLSAKVKDVGSGIGREEDVIMILDGQTLISQYDPPIEAVSFQPSAPLAMGDHLLEVVVRDRAGNESRSQSRFAIVP